MSNRLYVYALSGKAVPAKYLEINGEVIRDPSGNPYIVPADFDWKTYMEKFETFEYSLEARDNAEPSLPDEGTRVMRDTAEVYRFLIGQFHAAWPASPSDIQRTYNGYSGKGEGDFVPAFRPAASFLFGAACAASGLGEIDALLGGGAQNFVSWWTGGKKVKISLFEFLNNPENVPHIKNGWNVYTNGAAASGRVSNKPKTPTDRSDRPPAPIAPTKPHSSLEAPPTPYRPASLDTGTLGPPDSMAVGNRFPSPDMSRGYPTQFADPFAQYADRGFSPLTENPYVPGQGGPARPNLLDSPSSFDSLAFGTSNPPQVIAQPSRQPGGKSQVKAGQARKAPFYSLQDRLDFLGRVYRVAKPVSEATGLSLPFILAHAAHEVQFGKNIRENNLFNLKADKDWQGSTHLKGGNEYRSYPSYEESMKDYLGYLQANPRYGKMFEPVTRGSLGRLVDAIHYAGYSDDPLYGFRILAAAKDPIMKQALWQYQHWPPGDTPL
jgi:flagellum-specific peptidoglycan hydrolase FlgJ